MRKILLTLLVATTLTACTKEQITTPPQPQTVLVRVESVSKTGTVTYSDIVSVKLK